MLHLPLATMLRLYPKRVVTRTLDTVNFREKGNVAMAYDYSFDEYAQKGQEKRCGSHQHFLGSVKLMQNDPEQYCNKT